MKRFVKITIALGSFAAFFNSCSDDKNYPDAPELTVREFYTTQDSIVWRIGFTDGDGDIGVRNISDPDNFINSVFSIEDGAIKEIPAQSYRIPVVENIRTDKGIEGEFIFRLEKDLFLVDTPIVDTAFMRAYVVDRSLKKSNVIETPIFTTR
jgi:hypothetical protein